ncbi:lysophospholipase L1-like esterase [Spinactinospora alkalitolerans]|uniref:Lysophospholipase L1-like esterase n=1 Tax=Spinactinospora alkalitolerans TaxID=687207 RepID=A0A852U3F8_9ACTN|nr:SGNH/GDSL hydrolase family protein [Spinactinospora alkalitolerans]NYE50758.1 lysophospholipase L1-like esterase [Spinactinospora alkalitolerans]
MSRTSVRAALRACASPALTAVLTGAVSAVTSPAAAATGSTDAPPAGTSTVRIMPLGDSITGSPGCWRALLWNDLRQAGHTGIDFVGTLGPQGCGVPHDGDNEGHGGLLVTDAAERGLLVDWLAATDPDVVLMHFGTNDVWSGVPTETILDAYGTLVAQMRASNPDMHVVVAQIIPMDSARSCAQCGPRVRELNAAIPAWAAAESTDRSPVVVVDQWTGFDTDEDTYDGVHPDASGDRKIADRWFPAVDALLSGA